jgi:hypothetical protein
LLCGGKAGCLIASGLSSKKTCGSPGLSTGAKPPDENPCRSRWGFIRLATTIVAAMQQITTIERASRLSCVQLPPSYAPLPVSVSSTKVTHECSLNSAPRARQVHALRPLGLGCCICCHRRRRALGPTGDWSGQHPIHVRYCVPCRSGLLRSIRGHLGNRIGGLGCVQR